MQRGRSPRVFYDSRHADRGLARPLHPGAGADDRQHACRVDVNAVSTARRQCEEADEDQCRGRALAPPEGFAEHEDCERDRERHLQVEQQGPRYRRHPSESPKQEQRADHPAAKGDPEEPREVRTAHSRRRWAETEEPQRDGRRG